MSKAIAKLALLVVLPWLLGACQSSQKVTTSEALVGMWNIDEVNGYDEYLVCFVTNVLYLDPSVCRLPVSNGVCDSLGADDSGGIWNLSKAPNEPYSLTIGSRNTFFSGKYTVVIEDDSLNRLMKMHLFSDRLDLLLRKWHVSYDQERDLIRRLAQETSLAADSVRRD
jgi:hypothetical protein